MKQRLILCTAILLVASCSLFETREPESPQTGTGLPFIQPERAEIVLENLQNAVASMNLENYLRSLDENEFSYQPTNEAQNSFPDLWGNWSYSNEETYFNNLRSASQSGSGHELQLSNIESETLSSNEQQITVNYALRVNHNRAADGIPTQATGIMILYLVMGDDGLWSIRQWTDFSSGGSYTWSDLRSTFF